MAESYVQLAEDRQGYSYDDFEGAAGSLTTLSSGESWDADATGVGGTDLVRSGSGTAKLGGTTETFGLVTMDPSFSDGVVRVRYRVATTTGVNQHLRIAYHIKRTGTTYNNYYVLQMNNPAASASSVWGLYKNLGAGNTLIVSGTTEAGSILRNGQIRTITIVMNGTNTKIYDDSILAINHDMAAGDIATFTDPASRLVSLQIHASDRESEYLSFEAYPLSLAPKKRRMRIDNDDDVYSYFAQQDAWPTFTVSTPAGIAGATNRIMASFFNGSTKVLRLKKLFLYPVGVTSVTGIEVQFGVRKISSTHTGGTALTINSVDTDDSLPSGIVGVYHSATITAGGTPTTLFSYFVNNDEQSPNGATGVQNWNQIYNNAPDGLEIKETTFAPGEGMDIIHITSTTVTTQWYLLATFTVGD